jgi:hypothetical protein
MDEKEMNGRHAGFMTGVGLLLDKADPATRSGILETLKSLGDNLHYEIASENYATTASNEAVNPCPPGYRWDSDLNMCVPIIID